MKTLFLLLISSSLWNISLIFNYTYIYLDLIQPLHKWVDLPETWRHLYLFIKTWIWPTAFFVNKEPQGA